MNSFKNIYKNKTVLITGHTGFKGSWLALWLNSLGANIIGLSDSIPSTPSNFEVSSVIRNGIDNRYNILDTKKVCDLISDVKPDFVFHLAAQALVRFSYENPLETITTNAIGSANILEALRLLDKPVVAVMITSDKAYDNVEWVWGYRETDRLGGKDPYSASKGMAELAIRSYYESYFNLPDSNIRIGITRAGNVIGGGDWAQDRIVPDCMNAWSKNNSVDIRSPRATRPWQHVLEPLSGYLALGAELYENNRFNGNAYNFGPPANQDHSVSDLIELMAKHWQQVNWNDVSENDNKLHEAGLLKLNCDKSLFDLNWLPTLGFEDTVRLTVEWYKTFYEQDTKDMHQFTIHQIEEYIDIASSKNMDWANND
ncbi:CDP-glucose 4,6-dehydratase [Gammaproteobacteria bacterium]|nr:CDP-glucose 4,6-dehydratase [Gammaproteobacteria bacterium]